MYFYSIMIIPWLYPDMIIIMIDMIDILVLEIVDKIVRTFCLCWKSLCTFSCPDKTGFCPDMSDHVWRMSACCTMIPALQWPAFSSHSLNEKTLLLLNAREILQALSPVEGALPVILVWQMGWHHYAIHQYLASKHNSDSRRLLFQPQNDSHLYGCCLSGSKNDRETTTCTLQHYCCTDNCMIIIIDIVGYFQCLLTCSCPSTQI